MKLNNNHFQMMKTKSSNDLFFIKIKNSSFIFEKNKKWFKTILINNWI